jgi:hypothetical protein
VTDILAVVHCAITVRDQALTAPLLHAPLHVGGAAASLRTTGDPAAPPAPLSLPLPILAAFFGEDQVHDASHMMEGVLSFLIDPLSLVF